MIKFFKKYTEHLKINWFNYGLETVVVIVGVLIALAVNNWNEDRKKRITMIEYLHNIKDDIIADTLEVRLDQRNAKIRVQKLNVYYEYFNKREWTIQQIVDSSMSTGYVISGYAPMNATYLDMVSSGNTGLLNDKLRTHLANLKQKQDILVYLCESINLNIYNNIHEVERYWDMEKNFFFKRSISKFRNPVSFFGTKNTNEEDLMRGLQYQHNINNWSYRYFDVSRELGELIVEQSIEILDLIEDELDK